MKRKFEKSKVAFTSRTRSMHLVENLALRSSDYLKERHKFDIDIGKVITSPVNDENVEKVHVLQSFSQF